MQVGFEQIQLCILMDGKRAHWSSLQIGIKIVVSNRVLGKNTEVKKIID